MQAEKFKQMAWDKTDIHYGPPSTEAQEGLSILIDNFLGDDWYSVSLINTEQINTEAIYEILSKYPTRRDKKERLKESLINFINKLLK